MLEIRFQPYELCLDGDKMLRDRSRPFASDRKGCWFGDSQNQDGMTIPVAGVGASAGGLEAFCSLLVHLPANADLAFVFVQHLDPKHHSNLTEILGKVSPIPVLQAADGMQIEPNHLYVIPPDTGLELAGRVLRITPRAPASAGPHMPIDHFLRSLAKECGSRAIGVILSGAGTDGAAGLHAVRVAGGVTLAQHPTTAKFTSMPEVAIDGGCVDLVLSPEPIAAALKNLGRHTYVAKERELGIFEIDRGRQRSVRSHPEASA
jgi:two-component system, chemotaxis family, CheB/CheR fusion protein